MTVEYLPIANDPGANVVSQAEYETSLGPGGDLQNGYEAGTAQSNQVNKTVRQSSVMTAAMANFIADVLGVDVLDDGDVDALKTLIKSAVLNQGWSTGDVKITLKTVADAGWIMINDGTIGSGASGATYANDNAKALFLLLWTNVLDAWAPVVGGRGGSALADWNANKKLTLTKALGRALAFAGAGAGLTARALGQNLGEETHILTVAEMPVHAHGLANVFSATGASFGVSFAGAAIDQTINSTDNAGGGGAHNNMQPSSFFNGMIKL